MDAPTNDPREPGDDPTAASYIRAAQSESAGSDSNTQVPSDRQDGSESRGADGKVAALAQKILILKEKMGYVQHASISKRKSFEPHLSAENHHPKRARLATGEQNPLSDGSGVSQDVARQLPAEIWHHIFTFLPPRSLGILLAVNKHFQAYLDPSFGGKTPSPIVTSPDALPFLKPDSIWQASRQRFWSRMPSPLKGRSELDMWRLTCSLSCQFCRRRELPVAAEDPLHRGPGQHGVSPIFPFFLSSCAECLLRHSMKELDVVLSSLTPSILLPGIPLIFFTVAHNVMPPRVMEKGGVPPPAVATKRFLINDLDSIKVEFEAVKALGPAAAEEWIKGLEARGKDLLKDLSRWEIWFLKGGVRKMRRVLDPAWSTSAKKSEADSSATPATQSSVRHAARKSDETPHQGSAGRVVPLKGLATTEAAAKSARVEAPPSLSGQLKRTKEEVTLLKAKRRSEIERRASLLDPPIGPNVLVHIPSFQAALQIITPLDDNAWEILKARLVTQRGDAEQREGEIGSSARTIQEKTGAPETKDTSTPKTKEATDKEWDDVQGPLRARISGLADEIIKGNWRDGDKVTKKSCGQFAAEVLLYVRNRFYAEVGKDAIASKAAGSRLPTEPKEGPWTRKLTLENIKWVFDLKVRPLTEHYRKDLFLCNGCETTQKTFGFEAVVQHYAAKHTNTLSAGSMVVNWRSEWPQVPVFRAEPKKSVPRTRQVLQPPAGGSQSQNGNNGHISATPMYPIYHEPNDGRSHGPQAFIPTPNAYALNSTLETPHGQPRLPPVYPHNAGHPPHTQEEVYVATSSKSASSVTYPVVPAHDPGLGAFSGLQDGPAGVLVDDTSKPQLEYMERVSKEVWTKLAPVKELPGSVKIYITIHHIAKRYKKKHLRSATLDMFIDALAQCKAMRVIRSVKGLACGVCGANAVTAGEAITFSLPDLAQHFKHHHSEAESNQPGASGERRLRDDMVLLPVMSDLLMVRAAFAKHKSAHRLAAGAIPWVFDAESLAGTDTKLPYQPERNGRTQDLAKPGNAKKPLDPADHKNPRGNVEWQDRKQDEKIWTAGLATGHKPAAPSSEQPQRKQQDQYGQDRPFLQPASVVYGIPNDVGSAGKKDKKATAVKHHLSKPKSISSPQPPDSSMGNTKSVPRPHNVQSRPPSVGDPSANIPTSQATMQVDTETRGRGRASSVGKWDERQRQPEDRTEPRAQQSAVIRSARPTEDNSHHVQAHDQDPNRDVIPARPRGGEMRPEMRQPQRIRGSTALGEARGYEPRERRRSQSPRFIPLDEQRQPRYRDRSPRPVYYPSPAYYAEPGYPAYRAYPEDGHVRGRPPVELFEIVEVRDPQGDYFIKRPIQRETEGLAYQRHVPASGAPAYPQYATAYVQASGQPTMQQYNGYPAASARGQPPGWSEYEDYDPRFPGGASTPRAARY